MELQDIKNFVVSKFKNPIPSYVFLDNMRMIDEESRKSFAYNELTYIPFYYWLGKVLKPVNMIEIGFQLGLLSGTFLRACNSVERFLAFQEVKKGEYYSKRLGQSNIKDLYKGKLFIHAGNITDDVFEARFNSVHFDLALINEETSYDKYRFYFDMLWPQMSINGVMVADRLKINKVLSLAFKDFCLSKNVEPMYINTRYGIVLIKKA